MVDGKPDMQLPARAIIEHEKGTPIWHLYFGEHEAHLKSFGTVGDDRIFLGVGSQDIFLGLAHLGARVQLLKDAWASASEEQKQWLRDRGLTERNGHPLCPHVMQGESPELVGRDYETDVDTEVPN
jgi:hypothetical protein